MRIAVLVDSCMCCWLGAVDTAESTLAGAGSSAGNELQSCGRVDAPRKESKGEQCMLHEGCCATCMCAVAHGHNIDSALSLCSQMEDRVICVPNVHVNDRSCRFVM